MNKLFFLEEKTWRQSIKMQIDKRFLHRILKIFQDIINLCTKYLAINTSVGWLANTIDEMKCFFNVGVYLSLFVHSLVRFISLINGEDFSNFQWNEEEYAE